MFRVPAFAAAAALFAAPLFAQAADYQIDSTHSAAAFKVRHLMVSNVRGEFSGITGKVSFDPKNVAATKIEATIDAKTINTREPKRDEHLRSPDFFDVENYPEMTFTSTRIEEVDDDAYMVTGDLTIRDITRSIIVPLRLVGVDTDPFGNVRAGLEGSRRIDRRDWGVTWNTPLDSGGLLPGERIQLVLELCQCSSCGGIHTVRPSSSTATSQERVTTSPIPAVP